MRRQVIFGIVVAAIILLWGASWYFIPQWYDKTALEAGTFGDMFGAVNALFSGLAFAGLIYTITVQRQELSLQREAIEMQTEELKIQREETARSADQLEGQRQLLNLQIATTTINELIASKNKRIETYSYVYGEENNRGIDALGLIFNECRRGVRPQKEINFTFEFMFNPFFYILQYIVDADLTEKQKNVLAKLLDIDTSDYELHLIYNHFNNDQHKLALLKKFNFDRRVDVKL